jgi:hypothetical protein
MEITEENTKQETEQENTTKKIPNNEFVFKSIGTIWTVFTVRYNFR